MKLCWDNINKLSYDLDNNLYIEIKYYKRKGRLNLQKAVLKYKVIDACDWCNSQFLGPVNNKNTYCSVSCSTSANQTGKPGKHLGKKHSKEARNKISKANTGKIRTKEMRKHYSDSKKGAKNPMYGIKGEAHHLYGTSGHGKGYNTKINLEKMYEGLRNKLKAEGLPYNKEGHPFKGVKRPDRAGPNSHFWKGGIATVNDSIRKSLEYTNWRDTIFERDKYTCNDCNIVGTRLVVHHLIPLNYILYKDLDILYDTNNGLTLCEECHKDLHKLIGYKI